MAKTDDKNDLGYLGQEFQYKLIHTLMEEKEFFKDLHNIIDQNMFTDSYLKTFVGVMKEYYVSQETVPSYSIMEIRLNEKAPNATEREIYQETLRKIQSTPSDGVDYIRELAERFFRQQNIIKTANEILKIAGNGDTSKYERCVDLLNEALNKGTKEECGTSVMTDINETLSDDYRIPIPTGIGKLDETLEGGIGKGELGVIIGPTSFGKAVPNDSIVMTPDGATLMGNITVGDYVIGRNGKPTKVLAVYPHKDLEFYNLKFNDGVTAECCKQHLWAVNSLLQRTAKVPDYSYQVMSLEEMMKYKIRYSKWKYNYRIPMGEAVEFNEINVALNPYIMGLMIASNNIRKISEGIGVEEYNKIIIDEKQIVEDYNTYYPVVLTPKTKYIHNDYMYNSFENRILLLNGIMDVRGTVTKIGISFFKSKSKQLAEDIRTLVLSLGGLCTVKERRIAYNDLSIYYEVAFTLSDERVRVFTTDAKQARVIYRSKDRFLEKVEPSRICDGTCITVEAEDELYVINDFIVTHNTSLTTAMASHAATFKCPNNNFQGYKVLQIVFEDRIKQIQRKHIGRITGVESRNLSKAENADVVREQLEKYPDKDMLQNNLRIIRFPSGEITQSYLKRFIKKLINDGFKPDMAIIDYFECLANEVNTANEYSDEGKTMRKLESMAGEFDMALWIPSQGTKDSINAELVTMDKMGGSVKKAQIAHIIMSIARTVEDIERNLATIAILKNRAGVSGKVYNNVEFNNGTCRISTDNVDEFDSMVKFNENKNKELVSLQKQIFKSTQK